MRQWRNFPLTKGVCLHLLAALTNWEPQVISPPDLKSRLTAACECWARANDAPISRIAKRVTGSASFFDRLKSGGGCTTATLEQFGRALVRPDAWRDGMVPDEVIEFAHIVGVSAPIAGASIGQSGELSGQEAA